MTELILAIAFVLFSVWYVSTQAGRLDRLHNRVNMTSASLDAQLTRRAAAVTELAHSSDLDPVSQVVLGQSAYDSLSSTDLPWTQRVDIENQLTDVLADVCNEIADLVDSGDFNLTPTLKALLTDLDQAWQALQLSRRFHAEAVRNCLVIREQKLVRWLHLAGHAELPTTHDFNDEIPVGLTALITN